MASLEKVMSNAMAALDAVGVDFDIHVTHCNCRHQFLLNEIRTDGGEEVDFSEKDNFTEIFNEFAEKPKHAPIAVTGWAQDGDTVLLKLERSYVWDDDEWQAWAEWCGYDNPLDAQHHCGNPENNQRLILLVRIDLDDIKRFVRKVVPYCW